MSSPSETKRRSSGWSSPIVIASGSPSTPSASAKRTPCFRRFARAFAGSQTATYVLYMHTGVLADDRARRTWRRPASGCRRGPRPLRALGRRTTSKLVRNRYQLRGTGAAGLQAGKSSRSRMPRAPTPTRSPTGRRTSTSRESLSPATLASDRHVDVTVAFESYDGGVLGSDRQRQLPVLRNGAHGVGFRARPERALPVGTELWLS